MEDHISSYIFSKETLSKYSKNSKTKYGEKQFNLKIIVYRTKQKILGSKKYKWLVKTVFTILSFEKCRLKTLYDTISLQKDRQGST